jgi:transcriptional regulator with XRE-family HTH domain
MNSLVEQLNELGLSQRETSRLLDVNERTVRRWIKNPNEIPATALQAISAWVKLQRRGLAWHPHFDSIGENDAEISDEVARLRKHNIDLERCLEVVENRGGPNTIFDVDLKERRARSSDMEVRFYPLHNGGFSPASYRMITHIDREDVSAQLQDAYYAIAQALVRAGSRWYLR